MLKSISVLLFSVVLLGGLVSYHYGFVSGKVDEVTSHIERETAVARAEKRIRSIEDRADSIRAKSRQLRIDARAREMRLERESERLNDETQKLQLAMKNLAVACKAGGLPRPSEMKADDFDKKITFGGKTLTGREAVEQLQRWQAEMLMKPASNSSGMMVVTKIRDAADQLEAQSQQMFALVGDVRGKLKELEMQRDLARVQNELAELAATSDGAFEGELGDTLEVIQREIDERLATVEVIQAESGINDRSGSVDLDTAASAAATMQSLDALFED